MLGACTHACRDDAGRLHVLFLCLFLLLLSPCGKLDRLAAAAAGWGCILPQGPGALTPGKTWIGWMGGRGTDWVVFLVVVGLEHVGVLEQQPSKWSNNLSTNGTLGILV